MNLYNYTKTSFEPAFQNQTLVNGNYIWNVKTEDNQSNTAWASSNYSFSVDTVPETLAVSLSTPADSSTDTDGIIEYVSNATDNQEVVNATLWTNVSGNWLANETRWNGEIPYNNTGLISLWHFNNETNFGENSSLAYDWSGNQNNQTCSGSICPTINVNGKFGSAFEFDGTDDYLTKSYDSEFDFGTGKLTIIGWFNSTGASSGVGNISSQTSTGTDDAEEPSNGDTDTGSTDLEMVYDGADQIVGMRFQSINIPQGATITNAYIRFVEGSESDTGATSLTFWGEDIDNPTTFSTAGSPDYNISGRTKTTAAVNWTSIPSWNNAQGTLHDSPALTTIIQELVDRSGWSSGNSMVLIVNGTGERTTESYEQTGNNQGPTLFINYTNATATYLLSRYDSDQGYKVWLTSDGNLSFGIDDDAYIFMLMDIKLDLI